MASGEENRDDPVEDADERLAADRKEERSARSQTFYQPLSREAYNDSRYEPEEVSFFSRSDDDRAEQAQRAAQRVRRRIPEEGVARSKPLVEEASSAPSDVVTPPEPLDKKAAPQPDDVATPSEPARPTIAKTEATKPNNTSLLDRAVQAPAVAAVIPQPSKSTNDQDAPERWSLLDRATELADAGKRNVAPGEDKGSKAETPSASDGSLMDRMVDRPVPEKPKPENDDASLMDRAMEQSAAANESAAIEEAFEPKAVLSAKPKPRSPGAGSRYKMRAAKTPVKTVVDTASTKPTIALAKKAANAIPLADRMKQLVKTKSSLPVPAEKTEPKKKPKPRPLRAATPEEAVFAAPLLKPEARKQDPVIAPVPTPEIIPDVAPEPATAEATFDDRAIVAPISNIRMAKTKPFAAFEWMIAGRYLGARKKEGFVSVIAGFSLAGIALGVATLIVVMAVMTGFRETLVSQIIGGSPHINVYSQSENFADYDALADQIRAVDGVTNVTPVVQGQVLATGNQRHSGVIVRGMRKADLERLIANAEPEVINGSLEKFVEDDGVALGADLAAKLGLRVGDFVTLISPDGDITPFQATPLPRVKDYRIIQTFKLGVQEIDYGVAFMPFEEAQIYFNKQKQADTLDVFVDDPQRVSPSLANIEPGSYEDDIFRSARSSISVNNWMNLNGRLIGAINLERQVMFVILTMIILVAALNIISGLVMLVKDKARDVAIMRTMGMARGSILRIFFVCGSSIGVIGSILGVILGVTFVLNIHSVQGFVEWVTGTRVWDPSVRAGITEIPTKLQFSDVALTLFIALGLSFIATLFPAWKAAKLDPVEALRYE